MRYFITLIFLFITGIINAQTFVVKNDQTYSTYKQQIESSTSKSTTPLDEINTNAYAVISSKQIGSDNGGGGTFWGLTYIPGTTNQTGYVALGVPNMLPACDRFYVKINSTINIRPNAGNTGNTNTDYVYYTNANGQSGHAQVFAGQMFALVSSSPTHIGKYDWYNIYLTVRCSQATGWIANDPSQSQSWLSGPSQSETNNVLEAPTLSYSNLTNSSVTISAANKINYSNRFYDLNINGSTVSFSNSNVSNPYVPVTDNTTINNLNACTPYNVFVVERNPSGCRSQNITIPFTTLGCNNSCTYSIYPTSISPTSSANSGSISVTANSGCNWTAISNNTSWLTITSGNSGSGNGTVNYSYTQNATSSRTGTITIAGQIFTVTQAGTSVSNIPTITSVSPIQPSATGTTQPFIINGNNFVSGCKVNLYCGATSYLDRIQSSFTSTQVTINPNFGSTAAQWYVEVVNPDGQTTGQFPFNVVVSYCTNCITCFGTLLGTFNGVDAYSNCNANPLYVSNIYNSVSGIITGMEWQCVEYVNRYYKIIYGLDLKGKNVFKDANSYYSNATAAGLNAYPNGGVVAPQIGDIICSNGSTYGHIAIVKAVNPDNIEVIQQNLSNAVNGCYKTLTRAGNTIGDFASGLPVTGWLRYQTTPPPTTTLAIDVSNTIIPPWQREKDLFNGQVMVTKTGDANALWHLEIYINNNPKIKYASVTGNKIIFYSDDPQLNAANLHNGDILTYYAVLDETNTRTQITDQFNSNIFNNVSGLTKGETHIIEKKWDKKNVVYYNNGSEELGIPIKYDANYANDYGTNIGVFFSRVGKTATTTFGLGIPESILPNTGSLQNPYDINYKVFNNFQNGYIVISPTQSKSNLQKVFPGDIQYDVYKIPISNIISANSIETGYFDLTKIGKIGGYDGTVNILVEIGGIFNEIEGDITTLKSDLNNTNNSSTSHYSTIEYCRNLLGPNYSTWYIAQGNSNYIKRNAHDVGIALDSINAINSRIGWGATNEIDLFCHSKGGLDTRAMLSSYTSAYNSSNNSFNYYTSAISPYIKKVIFFDTPHLGAYIANKLNATPLYPDIPAMKDLELSSSAVSYLKRTNLPTNINFANITGYINKNSLSDAVVRVDESWKIGVPSLNMNNVIQLFQNDNNFINNLTSYSTYDVYDNLKKVLISLSIDPANLLNIDNLSSIEQALTALHINIHESSFLTQKYPRWLSSIFWSDIVKLNCADNNNSNLQKIYNFLKDANSISSCNDNIIDNSLVALGSKLSGANISIKTIDDSTFRLLGATDENGHLTYNQLGDNLNTDTIKIVANGFDSLLLDAYDIFNVHNKAPLAMIKNGSTNKIQYPSLSFVNPVLVTNNPSVQINVTAKNANGYDISRNILSSLYSPLTLTNNVANINLDTGYNKITVRYNGIDTQYQTKEIYYFPDTLYNDYSWDIALNTSSDFLESKIFINDKYFATINNTKQNVRVLKGVNQIKISKTGYIDTTFTTDTAVAFNLQLTPINYSSTSDSSILFSSSLNPQYWKAITTKNLLPNNNTQISVKQYDDSFVNMGLLPQTRKFVFRNLNSPQPALLKTAIALDQIITPDSSQVYLLNIKNGNQYFKFLPNTTGICEYDPEVQKIAFNNLNFINNAATEELVLMKKQAPIINNNTLEMYCGETKDFPLSTFFSNPDSIKNDVSASSLTNAVQIVNGMVRITAPLNNSNPFAIKLSATHDFITVTNEFAIKLNTPLVFVPSSFTPNGDGRNDIFKPKFYGSPANYHFLIFNRYGQKIFESNDYTNGWDGKINGVNQTGTFVWVMEYQLETMPKETKKGTVTLIR